MLNLDEILHQAKQLIQSAHDLATIEQIRVQFLGKKGTITNLMKQLGDLSEIERPMFGQKINNAKLQLQQHLEKRFLVIEAQQLEAQLKAQTIDVTLPPRGLNIGTIHPIQKTIQSLRTIFGNMGFSIADGPEIEEDYFNFTALNIPPLHPARAMQATFYFSENKLLRTQMSPVQIHTMRETQPPLRMIAIGKVYRRDFDITHTPMFHQMEGLMVSKGITFGNLKSLVHEFLHQFFERPINIRFRPSYFPFTEPSAEVDISCIKCDSKGCRICKNTGWLEVLGCGMVHPNVLNEVKIDSQIYKGFAFGLGIDRITMLKYNISDLRALFENDIRFLKQFN